MKFLTLTLSVSLALLLTVSSLVGALPASIPNSIISSSFARDVPSNGDFDFEGFNFPADDELKAHILAAIPDTLDLIHTVIDTEAWNAPFFDHYFPPETVEGVANTFRNILNGVYTQIEFDNAPRPDVQDPQHRDVCLTHGWAAFTMPENQPKPWIHFCPGTWNIAKLSDIVEKICPLPQVALNPGRRVRDIGYGPLTVQNIRKDTPDEALNNADNYMWFALV
ncbi:MAG: hypothetical protein Q9168_006438 [Polycauliona sp. 1 TL-2023]